MQIRLDLGSAPNERPVDAAKRETELQRDPIPAEWGRGQACYANRHCIVDELRELAGRYQAQNSEDEDRDRDADQPEAHAAPSLGCI